MNHKILAIIVTYNGAKWVNKCFGSLTNSSIPIDIICVDNGSTDNTTDLIKKKYPNVNLIVSKENLGFGKANNIGLKKALDENYDFAFLLNQDAWVEPDTIEKLVLSSKANPEYGILSPIHLNGSGDKIDPKFGAALARQNTEFVNDLFFHKRNPIYNTTFVNAAVWLIPLNTIKTIGGFNPFYFMYGEDGDYCKRIIYHQLKVVIITDCCAYHARDNFHYKQRPIIENIKFHINEWFSWSYEEFLIFDRNTWQGITAALNRVLIKSINCFFFRQYTISICSIIGWTKFILHINKAKKDKKELSLLKRPHFIS